MTERDPAGLLARRQHDRFLMTRPQPLGLLPTLWFWREVRVDRPVIGTLMGLFMGVFAVAVGQLLLAVGVSLPVVFIAALFLPLLGLGLVERGLRVMTERRRRALTKVEARRVLPEKAPSPSSEQP